MFDRRRWMAVLATFPGIAALSRSAAAQPAKPPPDKNTIATATLLATLVETGSLDEAIKRNPTAKLSDAQLKMLREIPAAELAAIQKFQGRLATAQLPQLVLRRETIGRLTTVQDADVLLERTNRTNATNATNRPGDTIRPGDTANRPTPPTNRAPAETPVVTKMPLKR